MAGDLLGERRPAFMKGLERRRGIGMKEAYAIEMENISKRFGGVCALDHVTLKVKKGEVHALVGENGAGKSTLIKILAGALPSDTGTIKIDGKPVNLNSTGDGIRMGISVIYQELNLIPDLTIAENLFVGEFGQKKGRLISQKELNKRAKDVLDKIKFDIDPGIKVSKLSVGYMQMVEVAKALCRNVQILILDEPTAVLTTSEARKLFQVIKELKAQGTSIIYISHRMEEILNLSDSLTVLKDGKYVISKATREMTENDIITSMIGRELGTMFAKKNNHIGDVILEAKGLCRGSKVKNVSFFLREGEILGISGLVGAGKTETMRLLFGADKAEAGDIYMEGRLVKIHRPKQAIRQGLCYISEDRKGEGVILDMSVKKNMTMAELGAYTNLFRVIRRRKENHAVEERMKKLSIKAAGKDSLVSSLSGGNQQKVSLAKWVFLNSKVIILDEPTRGVDVGAKREIYKIIAGLAEQGYGIIFISSEMVEIINMCDRVLIMKEGSISGEVSGAEITEENIIRSAL